MASELKLENYSLGSISAGIFCVFFVISVLTLVYLNLISKEEMKLVSAQFPEFGESRKEAIVESYKISISVALFFIDIILVGPFAALSYFGDHIKPRRQMPFICRLSFFDLGVSLALVFTIALASAHILIIDCVSSIRLTHGEFMTIVFFNAAIFVVWLVITALKIYTYTPDQRRELAKYVVSL